MAKVQEVKFLSIGGGIGSFVWVNALRIHGVPAEDILVVSENKMPYYQLKKYCDAIGLTARERLRSDSGARPDNFWGFPGYGLSEAYENLKSHKFASGVKILLQLFIEPFAFGYYSPTAGRVYNALSREARRISWEKSKVAGRAVSIEKLPDGRFRVLCNPQRTIITNVVHLSLGHGKIRKTSNSLPAYELTESLWKKISKKGGTVLVVGRGTTAQKVVERLLNMKNIEVVSLHRDLANIKDSRGLMQRKLHSWRLQQFNWPRAAFSDTLIGQDLQWYAPSAVPNTNFINIVKKNIISGRYKIVENKKGIQENFTIDCTGFDERAKTNKLYAKLVTKYKLPLNPNGTIKTGEFFEVPALCGYQTRLFITGIGAANTYGPVDSFFGAQYAASKTLEILNVKKLDFMASFDAWFKWFRNKKYDTNPNRQN